MSSEGNSNLGLDRGQCLLLLVDSNFNETAFDPLQNSVGIKKRFHLFPCFTFTSSTGDQQNIFCKKRRIIFGASLLIAVLVTSNIKRFVE